MADEYGFDIKFTATKIPYLSARFGNQSVKIATFNGIAEADIFLKLLSAYGKQEYEKGVRDANNENSSAG